LISLIEHVLIDGSLQDPDAQLEQLRRNSVLGPGDLKLPDKKHLPRRDMPQHSAPIPEEALAHPHVPIVGTDTPPLGFDGAGSGQIVGDVPASAVSGPSTSTVQPASDVADAAERNVAKSAPTFNEPGFASSSTSEAAVETILSPTEKQEDQQEVAP
jgi:glycogenin